MKKNIHPNYYENCVITCACGNKFTTGSTMKEIRIELCNKCHPFYTGQQKFVDSARRVEKFKNLEDKVKKVAESRKGKKVKAELRKDKKAKAEKKEK